MILENIRRRASENPQHIILPEGEDARTVQAAAMCARDKIAKITVVGNEEKIRENGSFCRNPLIFRGVFCAKPMDFDTFLIYNFICSYVRKNILTMTTHGWHPPSSVVYPCYPLKWQLCCPAIYDSHNHSPP